MNDTKKRSLSPQQRTRLVALLSGPSRLADEPKTTNAASAWWQTHRSLVARGYCVEGTKDGSAAFELTGSGRAEADAIAMRSQVKAATSHHSEGAALQ